MSAGSFQVNGTTARIRSRKGLSPFQAKSIADTLQKIANSFNFIFQFQKDKQVLGPSFATIQSNLKSAVSDTFHAEGPRLKSQAGINFNFGKGAKHVFELSLSEFSRELLVAKLERNPSLANDLLFGSSALNDKGLVDNFDYIGILVLQLPPKQPIGQQSPSGW